jgi:RNA polymerase sigma factor (sigma-70 family)
VWAIHWFLPDTAQPFNPGYESAPRGIAWSQEWDGGGCPVAPMEPFARPVRHAGVKRVSDDVEQEVLCSEATRSEAPRSGPGPIASSDLTTLYSRQREAMVRLARLLTGSTAIGEEVVQEAFLKMHQLRQRPENPEGYLRTSVVNLSRSHMRRLRLERRVSTRERVTFTDPEIDETWEAVCRLPYRQRAVLALRFYEDLSEVDIASVLRCRPGTVKSSLHRGLSRLREELS